MMLLIGTKSCSRCNVIKGILNNKHVNYEYKDVSELPEDHKEKIFSSAKEKGLLNFPILLKDTDVVTISDII